MDTDTYTQGKQYLMTGEIGVMQAKQHQGLPATPQKPRRGGEGSSPRNFREKTALLTLNFRTSSPRTEGINVCCFKPPFVLIGYGGPRKLSSLFMLLYQKHHRLGGLQITEFYCSHIWRFGSPRSRHWQMWYLGRIPSSWTDVVSL